MKNKETPANIDRSVVGKNCAKSMHNKEEPANIDGSVLGVRDRLWGRL